MPLILAAIAVGTARRRRTAPARVQMTQMPQMVALFNGVGGGAAALVALLELHDDRPTAGGDAAWFTLAATAFTIVVGSVSFAGSVVTFAKLQELMTSRPVVFPGLPLVFPIAVGGGVVLGVRLVIDPDDVGRHRARPGRPAGRRCCWCCRSAAPTYRSSSRCSTRSPA